MAYWVIKWVHVIAVLVSGALFLFRGSLSLANYPWKRWRILRWLPHVVDTVLLLSAIVLSVLLQQYPFVHGWLTAKVLALVVYIILGAMALRAGIGRTQRALYFLLALAVFIYIIGAARMHHPVSWALPWL